MLVIECEVGLQALFFSFGWLNTRIDTEDNAGSEQFISVEIHQYICQINNES